MLLVQRGTCRLYELFAAETRGRRWHAGSGAIFSLRSTKLRPKGWTSADAAVRILRRIMMLLLIPPEPAARSRGRPIRRAAHAARPTIC